MKKYVKILLIAYSLLMISCGNQEEQVSNNKELPNSPHEINPLKIGAKIPRIQILDINGKQLILNDLISQKPTILIYFRGGWCLFCNQHLGQIQEIEKELLDLGYQIIAVSADLSHKIKSTVKKHNLTYTLATDKNLEGAIALGLAFNSGSEYKKMHPVLEEFSGNKKHILPVPAAFIINREGIIQFEYINPNSNIRIASELLLTAAKISLRENSTK